MIYYVWPILWMGLIFLFSTGIGSSSNTFDYLEPLLRFLFPHITPHAMSLAHLFIRKLAHLTEYAILSFLWFRALSRGERRWSSRWALWALGLSITYALLDEYHQAFVPSRTGSLSDVGIDSMGALLSQVYLFITLQLIILQQPSPESTGDKDLS